MNELASAYLIRGDDGEEYGPVTLPELRQWVKENRAGLGTLVRLDLPEAPWQPWQAFPELIALLAEAQLGSGILSQPDLVLAPFWRRLGASILDLLLIWILATPIFSIIIIFLPQALLRQIIPLIMNPPVSGNQYPKEFQEIVFWGISLIVICYFTAFSALHGKTPGKACFGIEIVNTEGKKPGLLACFFRAFIFFCGIFYLFTIPILYAVVNPRRQGMHDFIAGTYVVTKKN